MKKNRPTVILALVLIAIAALLIWNNRFLTTLRGDSADFMVWDTASITKVYLADRMNHESLLERHDDGWTLNHEYRVHPKKVDQLLYTLFRVRIKMPVSVASHDYIIAQMASSSTKVEVYQIVPRINLFNKIKLFYHEKRTKVFYVGDATKDSSGTFMLKEGADQAYIVHIPGFRGYISTRFLADPDEWRDHVIFHSSLADIQSVAVEFAEDARRSFRIDNIGKHQYKLTRLSDQQEVPFDTLKVINMLSSFNDIRFEALLNNGMSKQRFDSITTSPFIHQITLVDKEGKTTSMKTFNKKVESVFDIPESEYLDDHDRMYALVNEGRDLVLIQNYIFDKVLKDISYYEAGNPIQLQIEHYQLSE
ncbi:MAG: DUF4340 domain-containing protein [Bacteroidales bacterium]|nr:DUF4340 domain-containing protein [Bacteroidales bacterium]